MTQQTTEPSNAGPTLYEVFNAQRLDFSLSAEDLIILVMGATGVGKSTFIQSLTGERTTVGHRLQSATSSISLHPHRLPDGRRLILVDTPGFNDGQSSDALTLATLSSWLAATFSIGLVPAGILCLYKVTDRRWTNQYEKNLALFQALWGRECLVNLCFVTNFWPERTAKRAFEDATEIAKGYLEYWDTLIKAGAQVCEFHLTNNSALDVVRALPMCARPNESSCLPLQIQVELVTYRWKLDMTSAGRKVEGDITNMIQRQERFLAADRDALALIRRTRGTQIRNDKEIDMLEDRVHETERELGLLRKALGYLKEAWRKFVNVVRFVLSFVLPDNSTEIAIR